MTTFLEIRFNDKHIIYNTKGGQVHKTSVVQTNGGREQRNAVWSYPLGMWEFESRGIKQNEAIYVQQFMNAVQGMLIGFRFKNWADFEDWGAGVVNSDGYGNNGSTGQMFKNYTMGSAKAQKKISKPVSGTITLLVNGSPIDSSIDHSTGIVTYGQQSRSITAATAIGTTSARLTIAGHGLQSGDLITFAFGGGWVAANGSYNITSVDVDFISIQINASGFGSFNTGIASWYPLTRETLTWIGEFDLPARFDSDDIQLQMTSADVLGYDSEGFGILGAKNFMLGNLKIVELKL